MNCYHIRLDLPRDQEKEVKEFLDDYPNFCKRRKYTIFKYLICYECGVKKSHYHIVVITDQKRTNLRSHIKEKFKLFGSDFSLSEKRNENLFPYVVKDNPPLYYKGYSEEEILEFRSKSYKKPEKSARKSQSFFQKLTADALQEEIYSKREIGTFILDYFIEHTRIIPYDRQLKSMIETIYIKKLIDHAQLPQKQVCVAEILDRVLFD